MRTGLHVGLALVAEIQSSRRWAGPVKRARQAFSSPCDRLGKAGERAVLSQIVIAHVAAQE